VPQDNLVILLPVYDDWDALGALLERIAGVLAQADLRATVVVLDDASTAPPAFPWPDDPVLAGGRLVALRRNLGHQRAIAIGLAYVHESFPGATTVVMDADGEDDPADIPRLLAAGAQAGGRHIVFAQRWRRSERLVFQLFYQLYRGAHWVLTGIPVKVGNYSVVPYACLERLVVVSELWSHYAAAVFKAKIPYLSVPTTRARRIAGESKMRFVNLVVHGLTAIAVFSDVVGVRLLIASSVLLALTLGALFAAPSYLPVAQAVPAVAGALVAGLLILLQATAIAAVFVFVILAGRQNMAFLPIRDHCYFIRRVTELPLPAEAGDPA
jgi:hypothetical protein